LFRGCANGTARLVQVAAVVEAALPAVCREFDKALLDVAEAQVMQSESLDTGAVYDAAFRIEAVQPRMGSRVFSGIEHAGDLARGGACIRDQGVDQRGFSHAGLADQNAELPLQQWAQRPGILPGAEFQHPVADVAIRLQLLQRRLSRQIALVQYDKRCKFLVMRCDQTARQQLVAERGFGGNDDDELGDIGGDEFFAVDD
jgi:hypothetical protein